MQLLKRVTFVLFAQVDTEHNCGYVTLIKLKKNKTRTASTSESSKDQTAIEKSSSLEPKNGKMMPENADLVSVHPFMDSNKLGDFATPLPPLSH